MLHLEQLEARSLLSGFYFFSPAPGLLIGQGGAGAGDQVSVWQQGSDLRAQINGGPVLDFPATARTVVNDGVANTDAISYRLVGAETVNAGIIFSGRGGQAFSADASAGVDAGVFSVTSFVFTYGAGQNSPASVTITGGHVAAGATEVLSAITYYTTVTTSISVVGDISGTLIVQAYNVLTPAGQGGSEAVTVDGKITGTVYAQLSSAYYAPTSITTNIAAEAGSTGSLDVYQYGPYGTSLPMTLNVTDKSGGSLTVDAYLFTHDPSVDTYTSNVEVFLD